ncbi:MarR family transcriptional regulator [Streptomyces sp. WI03-5b]|uniref:helix-turn-helix domain-containing protein n=1 Tax=Streptomyces sp. WI03-5b TaxID=462946 RepID=UPI0029A8A8E8|nr:MarR family transcriptional regulator [Streptomyces sp. WI03-5b]MDX2623647.1 MarR family transcriptional regulator [Streptomyces sp. WI03-5b]
MSRELLFAPVNAEGVLAALDLPQTAYRVLFALRSRSESGGRVEMGQNQIAALLGLSRPSVTSGLRELILARLVKKQRNGVYRINEMLAGYATQAEAQRAIEDMDVADRMNDPEFVARYHQAVEDYREQLILDRRKKLRVA